MAWSTAPGAQLRLKSSLPSRNLAVNPGVGWARGEGVAIFTNILFSLMQFLSKHGPLFEAHGPQVPVPSY